MMRESDEQVFYLVQLLSPTKCANDCTRHVVLFPPHDTERHRKMTWIDDGEDTSLTVNQLLSRTPSVEWGEHPIFTGHIICFT